MNKQVSDLIQKLSVKTRLGLVDWRETASSDAFQVSFSDYSLMIRNLGNDGTVGQPDFSISIINSFGNKIEEEYDSDLDEGNNSISHYSLMKEIFESARRKALGADKALFFLLKEIENL